MYFDRLIGKRHMLFEGDGEAGGAATLLTDTGEDGGSDGGNKGDGEEGAKESPSWMGSLPDEYKDHEDLKGFDSVGSFVKASLDNSGRLKDLDSGKVMTIPDAEASDEVKAAFSKARGVPEDVAGYEIQRPELPKGMEHDKAFEDAFKGWALEAGITPNEAQILSDRYNAMAIQLHNDSYDMLKANMEKATTDLQGEWKEQYKENLALSQRAFKHFGGEDFTNLIADLGLDHHPDFLRTFQAIGKAMSEDSTRGGGFGSGEKKVLTGLDGKPRLGYETDKQ